MCSIFKASVEGTPLLCSSFPGVMLQDLGSTCFCFFCHIGPICVFSLAQIFIEIEEDWKETRQWIDIFSGSTALASISRRMHHTDLIYVNRRQRVCPHKFSFAINIHHIQNMVHTGSVTRKQFLLVNRAGSVDYTIMKSKYVSYTVPQRLKEDMW